MCITNKKIVYEKTVGYFLFFAIDWCSEIVF